MDRCYWLHNDGGCYQQLCNDSGKTVHVGRCPFADALSGQISYCDMFVPDDEPDVRTSAFEKRASWADVAAKGRDIVATGGVHIVEENSEQIEAVVTSYQVAGAFPVYMGGPYDVILSKRSWENSRNVGGWVQGYLCSCEWGKYNSGQPGPGWQGRFCAHAYATLLEANARARSEFMGERTARVKTYGICETCGEYTEVDVRTGMCEGCHDKAVFESIVSAAWATNKKEAAKAEAFLVESVDNSEISAVCGQIEMRDIDENTSLACWNGYRAIVSRSKKVAMSAKFVTPYGSVELAELGFDGKGGYDYAMYPDEEFAEGYGMDPDPDTGGPMEEFTAPNIDEAKIIGLEILEDWGIDLDRVRLGSSRPLSKRAQQDAVAWDVDEDEAACELPDGSSCEVFQNADLEYVWELYSADGRYIDSDRGYRSLDDAMNGFERKHNVYRMARETSKVAFAKTATRQFTYAEMLELEGEIEGKPLHNDDRLRDGVGGAM